MTKEKIKFKDESGDRKYFVQIPNMIVNHSTAYEQSLYLIMKRLAGETGSCYASLNFLAKKMGVHKTTVSKTISKLLKRNWIKEIEPKKVKGGMVRQFIIVDIWPQNIKEYESGADVTTNRSGAVVDGSGAVVDGSGSQTDTKKNYKEDIINNNILLASQSDANTSLKKEVDFLINKFKAVNPSYERLFANKTQRGAMERLLKKMGRENLEKIINILPKIFGRPYAPRITTPLKLEEKLADLIAYLQQKKREKEDNGVAIL